MAVSLVKANPITRQSVDAGMARRRVPGIVASRQYSVELRRVTRGWVGFHAMPLEFRKVSR